MVRATSDDTSFADEFEKKLARRRIVNLLVSLRGTKGLTQKDVATRLECTQSRVSKIENSCDENLDFGDLTRYAAALGLTTHLMLMPRKAKTVDRVKYHAMQIKNLVDKLAGLAQSDPAIAKGVSDFFGEAAYNLLRILQEAAEKLPDDGTSASDAWADVEVCGLDEEKAPPPPKRVRKARNGQAAAESD